MNDLVTISHGAGGRQAQDLIRKVFVKSFNMPEPLTDSALLTIGGQLLAFTADSYVVDPLFFPGGNIGKIAVCGTVNDLAVSGAEPVSLSASFIIEEGFPVDDLIVIAETMASEAQNAGVSIVTGDTKVVGKGKCDKLFITTSGMGLLDSGRKDIGNSSLVKKGDKVIINGPVGDHAIAILCARDDLNISTPVHSDCASLNQIIKKVFQKCRGVQFMRDVTRGGLAAVLNEVAGMCGLQFVINEASIPVREPVRGVCEMLGFDPFHLANEGKFIMIIDPAEEKTALEILRSDPLGEESSVIGDVTDGQVNPVILNTISGGSRILDLPSGRLLPRIC